MNPDSAAVTREMSKSYCPAIEEHFSDALHVIDKFHVKQVLAVAMDEVRKNEQREAEEAFMKLYSWMRRCRLAPMKDAALTLMRHKSEILAYFIDRLTNAICEGINSLAQAAKRKARGSHTLEGYAAMIYLIAGKLKLEVPNPFGY